MKDNTSIAILRTKQSIRCCIQWEETIKDAIDIIECVSYNYGAEKVNYRYGTNWVELRDDLGLVTHLLFNKKGVVIAGATRTLNRQKA